MKKLIYFILLFAFFSCETNESDNISDEEEAVLVSFLGKYSIGTNKDGSIVVEVNCWSNSVEQLNFYKSEENYSFSFDGFHSYNYEVLDAELKDNKLVLSAVDPNYIGDMVLELENTEVFTFYFEEPFLIVESNGNKSLYIPESERINYKEIPCTEKEDNLELSSFLYEKANEYLVEEIFWMLDTIQPYNAPFREEASFPLVTPADGLYRDTAYIANAEELRAVVLKYFKGITPGYMLDVIKDKYVFVVEEFPDRCQPDKIGLFVKFKTTDEDNIESAEVMLTEASEEGGIIEVVFVVSFWWDENENIILRLIDLSECSA